MTVLLRGNLALPIVNNLLGSQIKILFSSVFGQMVKDLKAKLQYKHNKKPYVVFAVKTLSKTKRYIYFTNTSN